MAIHPVNARKRIADFLQTRTDIQKKVIRDLAIKELLKIKQCSNDNKPTTDDELKAYIKDHFKDLKANSETVILELSQKILPDSVTKYFFKQFGLITVFLVPPLYVCIDYTVNYLKDGSDLKKAVAGFVSSLLILALMISSALASILNKDK